MQDHTLLVRVEMAQNFLNCLNLLKGVTSLNYLYCLNRAPESLHLRVSNEATPKAPKANKSKLEVGSGTEVGAFGEVTRNVPVSILVGKAGTSSVSVTRSSNFVPLLSPEKPLLVKILDSGTFNNDRVVGGVELPRPLAELAGNSLKKPRLVFPIAREPKGIVNPFAPGFGETVEIGITSPGLFPINVRETVTPAALTTKPPVV